MNTKLINHLELLVDTLSDKEKMANYSLKGKTQKLVRMTNRLKALYKTSAFKTKKKELGQ